MLRCVLLLPEELQQDAPQVAVLPHKRDGPAQIYLPTAIVDDGDLEPALRPSELLRRQAESNDHPRVIKHGGNELR